MALADRIIERQRNNITKGTRQIYLIILIICVIICDYLVVCVIICDHINKHFDSIHSCVH